MFCVQLNPEFPWTKPIAEYMQQEEGLCRIDWCPKPLIKGPWAARPRQLIVRRRKCIQADKLPSTSSGMQRISLIGRRMALKITAKSFLKQSFLSSHHSDLTRS